MLAQVLHEMAEDLDESVKLWKGFFDRLDETTVRGLIAERKVGSRPAHHQDSRIGVRPRHRHRLIRLHLTSKTPEPSLPRQTAGVTPLAAGARARERRAPLHRWSVAGGNLVAPERPKRPLAPLHAVPR